MSGCQARSVILDDDCTEVCVSKLFLIRRYAVTINSPVRQHHSLSVGRLTGAISRGSVCVNRQGELKRGAVGYVCRGPQLATVSFHDRTADREPHTHATGFGGVESVEQPVRTLGGDPDAAIRHTDAHLLYLNLA